MNSRVISESAADPWWRGRWGGFAVFVFAVHVGVFWLVSGDPSPAAPRKPLDRYKFVATPPDPADSTGWRWLFSPALFVSPSPDDFSAAAWLDTAPVRVEVEPFAVPERPMPWESIRGREPAPALASRLDPAPGGRWEVPTVSGWVPGVSGVPLPREGAVMRVAGLAGRLPARSGGLEAGLAVPTGVEVGPALPVVLRVAVDERGELVQPPVVWESSQVKVYDEAALGVVRRLRFTAAPGTGVAWGLVSVEWPVAVGVEAGPKSTSP